MFKVVNVRGNSVRLSVSGVVTFDVQVVVLLSGKKIIKKPSGLYVDDKNMGELVKTVLSAYEFNEAKGFNVDETKVSA
jgi:hypothetical protein